ncbi:MAG: ribonuclease HII [Clostridia bacterium]|nr:ribonuclease HII [Clostridia bacterium]
MKEKEIERLHLLKEEEIKLYENNINYICGIDEAGRGPLAGPVVVGAVILPKDSFIEGVNDSKKISEKKREKIYEQIIESAISYSVGIVDQKTIDEINILNATKLGVKIALEGLKQRPDVIMVDALNNMDTLGIPYISVVKGDAKNYSIAAASIIAKVTRDRIMKEWDEIYPIYGFAKHKGYGTAEHIRIIKENGPCILHRKSFIKNFSK